MPKTTNKGDPEPISITQFKLSMLRDNSKISMIGRETNHRLLFKLYRNYFESADQVREILENLPSNHMLVIDETSPNNKLEQIIYYYKPE